MSVSNFCSCPGSVFSQSKETHFRWQLLFCFFSPPICFYRQHWTFQSDWCVNNCLLSCGVQQLLFAFSTGVCGSHCRRAASCKLQISFHTRDSPIESAYTCNHMLQPSDRSFPLPTGRDKLSPSTVPPCTLNILFRYTWTHFTYLQSAFMLVRLLLMCLSTPTVNLRLNWTLYNSCYGLVRLTGTNVMY